MAQDEAQELAEPNRIERHHCPPAIKLIRAPSEPDDVIDLCSTAIPSTSFSARIEADE
jgi:hypothetical protein